MTVIPFSQALRERTRSGHSHITVSIAGTPAAIADAIIDALREDGGSGGSSTVLSPPR